MKSAWWFVGWIIHLGWVRLASRFLASGPVLQPLFSPIITRSDGLIAVLRVPASILYHRNVLLNVAFCGHTYTTSPLSAIKTDLHCKVNTISLASFAFH